MIQRDNERAALGSFMLITVVLASIVPVHAAQRPSRGEIAVQYRQSLYTIVSVNFGPLGAMAEGEMPFDAVEAQRRAERLAFLAPLFKEAFPPDSNGAARTAARAEIWTEPAEFAKDLQAFIEKATLLAAVAKTGDSAKVKNAIQETGDTCRSCHYKFKARQ